MDDKNESDLCELHGIQKYLYSRIAEASLCKACLEEGYYRHDI